MFCRLTGAAVAILFLTTFTLTGCGKDSGGGKLPRAVTNELACVAALNQIVSTEQVWRQTASTRNGIQDDWTLDVAGFYARTDEKGASYLIDTDSKGILCANPSKFAFCGYPQIYNHTGVRIYIVNEAGVVYMKDTGTSAPVVTWPAVGPTTRGWVATD